jgi:hypothetical protein
MSDRRDPTRSLGLRRHGRALVTRRVYNLHQGLRQVFDQQDLAGLRKRDPGQVLFVNWAESASHRLARSEGTLQQLIGQTLTYPRDWPSDLIERSVRHGIALVETELRTSLGYIDPREVSRLHASAASSEVRGIAGETERRLLRFVVRALEIKTTPQALVREMRLVLEKITKLRLNIMVNTSVVRAVNGGKLLAYESEGISQVGIDPEWLPTRHVHDADTLHDVRSRKAKKKATRARNRQKRKRKPRDEFEPLSLVEVLTAGDDKVCEDCQDISEGGPYLIEEARDKIPAHPNCRCAFVPWGDARFAEIEREDEFE